MSKLHDKSQGNYHPIPLHGRRPPQPPDNWPYHNRPTTPNNPEFGIRNPKFERHIFISRDQILFDVDTQIQMIAMSRRKEDGTEDDRLTSATTTFKQMFYRWIDTHIGLAKAKMSAFVLEKFKSTDMNSIKDKEEVDITLLMPDWYDDTTFPQLTNAVHNYIVNAVLFEFFTVTLTSKDPVTVDKSTIMADELTKIKTLSNASKPGSIRKTQNPF